MFVCFVVAVRQNFRLIYTKYCTDCHKVFPYWPILICYVDLKVTKMSTSRRMRKEDYFSRRIKLGVRFEKRVSPMEKYYFTFKRLN